MSTTNTLPTRQQLEEIDALLKRMLALPPLAAESRDDPAAVAPVPAGESRIQSWRVEWPAPPADASPPPPATVAAWGSPVTPPAAHAAPRFNVYTPPVTPPAAAYYSPPFSPAYPPGYAPQAYLPTPVTPQPTAKMVTAPGRSPLLFPAVALNWVYDVLTYLLPLGSWWRTGGRKWLGRAGALMVLAAAGWAAGEWQGVEWPKPDLSKINTSRFGWAK